MPSPFQDRVAARQTFWAAGAFDAFSARLIEQAAFDAVFLSGYALSAALLGMPDIGLYTMTENVTALRNVRAAVDLPIVADGDTGYGGILNVQRTVRELAAAGAQAFTLEDQAFPKRCPLIEDAVEDLVSIDEGVSRVRAAVDVARPLGIAVIARTDARGMDEAMARSIAYVAAGADIVQPVGRAFAGIAELRELHARCGVPLSIMIAGWYRDIPRHEIAGVAAIATYPLAALLSAGEAMRSNLSALAQGARLDALPAPIMDVHSLDGVCGLAGWLDQEQRYATKGPNSGE